MTKPIEPIILTEFGERLLLPQGMTEEEGEKIFRLAEKSGRPQSLGTHEYCGGIMDVRRISSTHNVILCRDCKRGVELPRSQVSSYADLRDYLAPLQPPIHDGAV